MLKQSTFAGTFELTLHGQVRGGKNSICITAASGRRYPTRIFAKWRNLALLQIAAQIAGHKTPIFTVPVSAYILYTAGDKRKRDVPAVMDAIWHVLERSGVVADDSLIQDVVWRTLFNRNEGKVVIELTTLEE